MEPVIVIRLGEPPDAVEIGWDGKDWKPLSGDANVGREMCRAATMDLQNPAVGDHHFPDAVGPALRTAEKLGARVVKSPPNPPLPDGVIS